MGWNKKTTFIENINIKEVKNITHLLNNFDHTSPKTPTNTIAKKIAHIFLNSSNKSLKKKENIKITHKNNKPWFGPQCRNSRVFYNNARKKFKLNKTTQNKKDQSKASKNYKKIKQKFINEYKHRTENKHRAVNKNKPKDYWRFLNSLKRKPRHETPSLNELYDFSKEQNSSDDTDNDPIINLAEPDQTLNSPITVDEFEKKWSQN